MEEFGKLAREYSRCLSALHINSERFKKIRAQLHYEAYRSLSDPRIPEYHSIVSVLNLMETRLRMRSKSSESISADYIQYIEQFMSSISLLDELEKICIENKSKFRELCVSDKGEVIIRYKNVEQE